MFKLATDATADADGTATTTTGKPPWLLHCDTCGTVATDDPDETEPGDGFRFAERDLAALDEGDRELLDVMGWHVISHQPADAGYWALGRDGLDERRQSALCHRCAAIAGRDALKQTIAAVTEDRDAAERGETEAEEANAKLQETNTALTRQVRTLASIGLCVAIGAAALAVVLVMVAWAAVNGGAL